MSGEDLGHVCGRCYESTSRLFPAKCSEKPEALVGVPVGQYHCPDCGAMVLAGVLHPQVCSECLLTLRSDP
ncbi:MAG: hypothetical protein BWY99_02080 [Synergistetes bacterium ADurb.BinA166]|nr:MAG: hypothetical protein BWY99_02080 [Synergistetes bacterium ADurb.BinA166]